MSVFKFCLIAVLTVFSWIFSSLAHFLIDIVESFFIAIATEQLRRFHFVFGSIFHDLFSLISSIFGQKKKIAL